jgi:hypothetical protein
MKKLDPKPIERCYDCSKYSNFQELCLRQNKEINNCNIIPDWCKLEDVYDDPTFKKGV